MYQEDKIQKITFGNAVFQALSKKKLFQIINEKEIRNTLQENKWYINNGHYQKYNWQELFKYMIECKTQTILLDYNDRFQIISQIQHAQYVNLKILNIEGNKIENIQPLSFIYFERLQQLYLCDNQISQIKCLKKLYTRLLDSISICKCYNPLNQINVLIRSKINSKRLDYLGLQDYEDRYTIHQDLSVVVKLQTDQIQSLGIMSYYRIKQNKIKNMLKLRFSSLQVIQIDII